MRGRRRRCRRHRPGARNAGQRLFAAGSIELQQVLPHTEAHAALDHWAGTGVFSVTLIGLAAVAALRAPGWRLPLWSAGLSVAPWGAVSAALPSFPSSLGLAWGLAAVAGGAAFLAVGEREHRREAA